MSEFPITSHSFFALSVDAEEKSQPLTQISPTLGRPRPGRRNPTNQDAFTLFHLIALAAVVIILYGGILLLIANRPQTLRAPLAGELGFVYVTIPALMNLGETGQVGIRVSWSPTLESISSSTEVIVILDSTTVLAHRFETINDSIAPPVKWAADRVGSHPVTARVTSINRQRERSVLADLVGAIRVRNKPTHPALDYLKANAPALVMVSVGLLTACWTAFRQWKRVQRRYPAVPEL